MSHHKKTRENWFVRNWHPLCGLVFLVICLMDFIIMPSLYQYENQKYTPDYLVQLSTKFAPEQQVQALEILHEQKTWVPMTLSQNGLFFVCFGAILSAGIWSKNKKDASDNQAEFINTWRELQGQAPLPLPIANYPVPIPVPTSAPVNPNPLPPLPNPPPPPVGS